MFMINNGGFRVMSTAPDVCNLPTPVGPVPTPFVNFGSTDLALPFAMTVLVVDMPALNVESTIALTQGDEPGLLGGVTNAMIMMEAKFVKGSEKVMVEGMPAVKLMDMTTHNEDNTVGLASIPSPDQFSVMIGV